MRSRDGGLGEVVDGEESQPEPSENFLVALLTVSVRRREAFGERVEAWRRVRLYGFGECGCDGVTGIVEGEEIEEVGVDGEDEGTGEADRSQSGEEVGKGVAVGRFGDTGSWVSFRTTMSVRWRCLRINLVDT